MNEESNDSVTILVVVASGSGESEEISPVSESTVIFDGEPQVVGGWDVEVLLTNSVTLDSLVTSSSRVDSEWGVLTGFISWLWIRGVIVSYSDLEELDISGVMESIRSVEDSIFVGWDIGNFVGLNDGLSVDEDEHEVLSSINSDIDIISLTNDQWLSVENSVGNTSSISSGEFDLKFSMGADESG